MLLLSDQIQKLLLKYCLRVHRDD